MDLSDVRSRLATLSRRVPIGLVVAIVSVIALAVLSSRGSAITRVPDVVGLAADPATAALAASGFKVTLVEVEEGGASGTVIGQTPRAAALRERGHTVALLVTLGTRQVSVPDVSGLATDDARDLLVTSGLVPGDVTYIRRATLEPGTVIRTVPEAGTTVDAGAAVDIEAVAFPVP